MAVPRLRPYPQNGTITIADGETHIIRRGGNFVRVRQADQEFSIVFDEDAEVTASQNDEFTLNESDEFKFLSIINNSGGSLTFQLDIGFGKVRTNNVSINGTQKIQNANSPNDELQIKTKAGTELVIDDAEIITAIQDEIDGLKSLLQNDQNKRAALNTLAGASFASVTNSTTEVVSAAANTSGVVIRRGFTEGGSSSGAASIEVDGNRLVRSNGISGRDTVENYFVPAGNNIEIDAGASAVTYIWYEVL